MAGPQSTLRLARNLNYRKRAMQSKKRRRLQTNVPEEICSSARPRRVLPTRPRERRDNDPRRCRIPSKVSQGPRKCLRAFFIAQTKLLYRPNGLAARCAWAVSGFAVRGAVIAGFSPQIRPCRVPSQRNVFPSPDIAGPAVPGV